MSENEPIFSMLTGKGPLPGGGQTLSPFTLSGVPAMIAPPGADTTNVNGTYVDEYTYYGGNGPSPGNRWVSSDGLWFIYYAIDLGSCNCFTETNITSRALGGGWSLSYQSQNYSRMVAYVNGSIGSKPPSTGWYTIYNGMFDGVCSFNVDDPYTYVGFQDCDPSIVPPTQPYHPGYVSNLTFTPV